jgi:hypothetical protein
VSGREIHQLSQHREKGFEYDLFISHAHEDKDEVARPLANALLKKNLKVWIDEFELKVGDSLSRKIDQGLAKSRFGIVIFSENFFRKDWPQYELQGLRARETQDTTIILPIWHKVTKEAVRSYSPILADKVALNTTACTIEEIATEIVRAVRK